MRALVVTAPGQAQVQEVPDPSAAPGEVVIDVARAGVCGTDTELFHGTMPYVRSGHMHFPFSLGHEWAGRVSAVGEGVDQSWLGARVTGDTMLGCGHCRRCRTGRQHVCEERTEIGVRGNRPGALAERLAVPARALHRLPDEVDDAAGAMVEPGGNAYRAFEATATTAGQRLLVAGAGTIGLLTALFAQAAGVQVQLVDPSPRARDFATSLGLRDVSDPDALPAGPWDAVVNASADPGLPARALELVEPGGRVVLIGIAGEPSLIDATDLTIKDVTAVGILSASPGLAPTIEAYARGALDPRPLIAGTVSLDEVPELLAGARPPTARPGPKIHVALP